MPELYKSLQEFCSQHSRFKSKGKNSSGPPSTQPGGKDNGPGSGPGGSSGAAGATTNANNAPPSKKVRVSLRSLTHLNRLAHAFSQRRRNGKAPETSPETIDNSELEEEGSDIFVNLCNHLTFPSVGPTPPSV